MTDQVYLLLCKYLLDVKARNRFDDENLILELENLLYPGHAVQGNREGN